MPSPGSLVAKVRNVVSIFKVAVVDTQEVLVGMGWAISSRDVSRHRLYHYSYYLVFA